MAILDSIPPEKTQSSQCFSKCGPGTTTQASFDNGSDSWEQRLKVEGGPQAGVCARTHTQHTLSLQVKMNKEKRNIDSGKEGKCQKHNRNSIQVW